MILRATVMEPEIHPLSLIHSWHVQGSDLLYASDSGFMMTISIYEDGTLMIGELMDLDRWQKKRLSDRPARDSRYSERFWIELDYDIA